MTRDEALKKLKGLEGAWDLEMAHGEADDVLCALLKELGYGDVVSAYHKIDKWYA